MAEIAQCLICCENYNKTKHKPIPCPTGNHEHCKSCVETYLLDTPREPHCMDCQQGYSHDFLTQHFTQKFVHNTLRDRRVELILEREKSLLPETQGLVDNKIEQIATKKKIDKIDEEQVKVTEQYYIQIDHLTKQKNILSKQMNNPALVESAKKRFIMKCPTANCRGFLSTQYHCSMCECWVCSKCHELKKDRNDETHTCQESNIESVQAIKEDSKPCPSCGTITYRISGCTQMWCTECHTPWNWRTQKIEKGEVHNPHYFDYQRRNGDQGSTRRADRQNPPCTVNYMHFPGWEKETRNKLKRYRDTVNHVQYTAVPKYTSNQPLPDIHRELRINYMMGNITEEEWKNKLMLSTRKQLKQEEIRAILTMFVMVSTDLLRRLERQGMKVRQHQLNKEKQKQKYQPLVEEYTKLIEYTNTELLKVSRSWKKCVVPCILLEPEEVRKNWKIEKIYVVSTKA